LSAEKHFLIWPQRLLTKCLRTKTKAGWGICRGDSEVLST
jgi:hypothetical protein